jgi:hypothetical protein
MAYLSHTNFPKFIGSTIGFYEYNHKFAQCQWLYLQNYAQRIKYSQKDKTCSAATVYEYTREKFNSLFSTNSGGGVAISRNHIKAYYEVVPS